MARTIAVFQSQSEADAAVQEIARFDREHIRTEVYEGVPQDSPGGADTLAGPTITPGVVPGPVNQSSGSPGFVPFAGLGLNFADTDQESFYRDMYERGATLVVLDGDEELVEQSRRIVNQHGGRFPDNS